MSPAKGARRLLSADGGVWSLNIAIVIASVALLAGPVQHLPEFDAGVHLPWWGLALGFLAAERCVVHLHFRRSAHSFSLGDLPLVFGLLFASPIDLVVAGLVGPIVVLLIDRRLPAIKVVFNIAQFTGHRRDRLHALALEPLLLERRERPAALELEPLELEPGAGDPRQLRGRGRRPDALELEPVLLEPLELVDQLDQVTLARGPENDGAPAGRQARQLAA